MKRRVARFAAALGLVAAARRLQADKAVVLTYHGVLPDGQPADDFLDHNFVSASVFDRQLEYLCREYVPISLADLVRCYETGRRPPRRSIAVTFDDGFANNCSIAFPILRRRQVPFTVFVTTGMVGASGAQLWTERVKRAIYLCAEPAVTLALDSRDAVTWDLRTRQQRAGVARQTVRALKALPLPRRDAAVLAVEHACRRPPLGAADHDRYAFLTWEQVRTLAEGGVEIGSHTVNHPILSTLDDRTLEEELRVSKSTLERELGRECYALAYPNGSAADYGARERRMLERLGYRCALSLRGTLNSGQPDRFAIDRININRQHDDGMFPMAAAGLLGRARQVRDRWSAVMRRHYGHTQEVPA